MLPFCGQWIQLLILNLHLSGESDEDDLTRNGSYLCAGSQFYLSTLDKLGWQRSIFMTDQILICSAETNCLWKNAGDAWMEIESAKCKQLQFQFGITPADFFFFFFFFFTERGYF